MTFLSTIDVQELMQTGLAFLCATCSHWHEGVAQNIKDCGGETVCSRYTECDGPLSGKCFPCYNGPVTDLSKFCYVCGATSNKVLVPKVFGSNKVGCCNDCFEKVIKKVAVQQPGIKLKFTSDRRAGPDKFEATT